MSRPNLGLLAVVSLLALSIHTAEIPQHSIFVRSKTRQLSRTAKDSAPLDPPADLVLTNGRIYTGVAAQLRASALAVSGESIVAIAGTAKTEKAGGVVGDPSNGVAAQVKSWVG